MGGEKEASGKALMGFLVFVVSYLIRSIYAHQSSIDTRRRPLLQHVDFFGALFHH